MTVHLAATSWNCAKYITPRYTADEVRAAAQPLLDRIVELERQVPGTGAATRTRTDFRFP